MAIDFDAISEENRRRYGTEVGNYGPTLLADLYADRTHFIFELLQNAEDALRRQMSGGPRSITFEISERALTVRHFGEPFDEGDIQSICGIAKSTKRITDIGRFGIGFKSVYAWTDRPEIHSGGSDFAIENYVHPVAAAEIERAADETVIILPFKEDVADAHEEINEALADAAHDALRFLREIDEIKWHVNGDLAGRYLRERETLGDGVHRVAIAGWQEESETGSEWLVFSDPVKRGGERVGHVEIAFAHVPETADAPARITSVYPSPLCAYFPTDLSTPLRFLIQGPYRTTPARDNVPLGDEWNQYLLVQTAELLEPTLVWLRDHEYLTADALAYMPINEWMFTREQQFTHSTKEIPIVSLSRPSMSIDSPREPTRFYPLFQAVKGTLSDGAFLPAFPNGHIRPEQGLLGGTEALRKLFSIDQLRAQFGLTGDAIWLDPGITRDRSHGVYDYLSATLGVREVDTERIIRQLDKAFLEQQPDEWIRSLYEFLNDQSALRKQNWFASLPLVRLEDGTQVAPGAGDPPRTYLPTSTPTDFPTVRHAVCDSKESLDFLKSLGLREPDQVDDVRMNILPAYRAEHVSVDDQRYERDIRRIASAYKAVDGDRRDQLVGALRQAKFVRVIDAGSGESIFANPRQTYMPTDTLRSLFRDLEGVFFVDESVATLQGEDAKRLLIACSVRDHLRVLVSEKDVDPNDARWVAVRKDAGWPQSKRSNKVRDRRLDRLDDLLKLLPSVGAERQGEIARLLWDELRQIVSRNRDQFFGHYTWFYYEERKHPFDAQFVKQLNETAWIPVGDGTLVQPRDVTIESLGWPRDSFVEERIHFGKPTDQQTVEQLADKVGVSVEDVELMQEFKASGISPEEFRRFMKERGGNAPQQVSAGGASGPTPAAHSGQGRSSRTEFRSYIRVGRDQSAEPNSEAQPQRKALEAAAREHIRTIEPEWIETKDSNPGFDLYQADANGEIVKWCEVKSLGGAWGERPVTMSATQFKLAQQKGDAYWLYVVEHAGDPARISVKRIRNPAGLAETFTFDDGWAEIAEPTAVG